MRYVMSWVLVILTAIIVWNLCKRVSAAEALDCEQEILAWCKSYPGPSDVNCERMSQEECHHAPPSKTELCKLRAKRLCNDHKDALDRDACVAAKQQECTSS